MYMEKNKKNYFFIIISIIIIVILIQIIIQNYYNLGYSYIYEPNALSEISQILTNLNGSLTAVASPGTATESTTTTAFKPN